MIALYAAAMTLLVAGTFGTYGYGVWASVWCVIVFRTASRPRPGEDMSPDQEKRRYA